MCGKRTADTCLVRTQTWVCHAVHTPYFINFDINGREWINLSYFSLPLSLKSPWRKAELFPDLFWAPTKPTSLSGCETNPWEARGSIGSRIEAPTIHLLNRYLDWYFGNSLQLIFAWFYSPASEERILKQILWKYIYYFNNDMTRYR